MINRNRNFWDEEEEDDAHGRGEEDGEDEG